MKKCAHIALILLAITMLGACDGYNKLVKSTDYEAQYTEAMKYYNEGRYGRARQLFESLQLNYHERKNSEDISWYYAMTLLKQREYYLAAYTFTLFNKKFPYSEHAEEGRYNAAYCKYKDAPPSYLDQSSTKEAIAEFESFAERYPNSVHIPEVNSYIDELNNVLMQKDYDIAVGYYNVESYHAAYVALKNFINLYPDSPYRQDAMYYIILSGYQYGANSREEKMKERLQQVVSDFDNYSAFITNEKHKSAAQEAYTKSKALLAQLETQANQASSL